MISKRVSHRYAKALFLAASEKNLQNRVYDDMVLLGRSISLSEDLRKIVVHPEFSEQKRQELLAAVFEKRVDSLTMRFLSLLEKRGRIQLLTEICQEFESIYLEAANFTKVDVAAVAKLDDEQISRLERRLAERFKKSVLTTYRIDPDLIAGLRIQAGDQVLDLSIKNYLNRYQRKVFNAL